MKGIEGYAVYRSILSIAYGQQSSLLRALRNHLMQAPRVDVLTVLAGNSRGARDAGLP
jgi:hypothetical protein